MRRKRINMSTSKRFWLISAGLLVCLIIGVLIYFVNYFSSLQKVTITFKNIPKVSIYHYSDIQDGSSSQTPKPIKTTKTSGKTFELRKGKYIIQYEGTEGYEGRFVSFNLGDTPKKISLSPDFTKEKLEKILTNELPSINTTIAAEYPRVTLYEIQRGNLLKNGEWYVSSLKYIGSDQYNDDTLKIVLKKSNNSWEVASHPPNISLNKYSNPNIPIEILVAANSL